MMMGESSLKQSDKEKVKEKKKKSGQTGPQPGLFLLWVLC